MILDIETGPLPKDQVLLHTPQYVRPYPMLRKFEPERVRLGNTVDPEKIKLRIRRAKMRHEARNERLKERWEKGRDEHIEKTMERAALSPVTGKILCIGVVDALDQFELIEGDERYVLEQILRKLRLALDGGDEIVTFNGHKFDLPFIIRRAWSYRMDVPRGLKNGRWWNDLCVDLMERFALYQTSEYHSLHSVAEFFGLRPKERGIGPQFWEYWENEREVAIEYVKHDCDLTRELRTLMPL